MFRSLRQLALTVTPEIVGLDPASPSPVVLGVLMELGMPEGTATVTSLVDGTQRIWFDYDLG